MSTGTIVQVIGAVVDVEFPRDAIPKVYDALHLDDRDLTLEVQQQLGDGVVRAIAMAMARRGLIVDACLALQGATRVLGRLLVSAA